QPTGGVFEKTISEPSIPKVEQSPSTTISTPKIVVPKNRLQLAFERIDRVLEQWLQPKGVMLDQESAKILRQELEQMFNNHLLRDNYSRNLSSDIAKKIKSGAKIYIEIPNALGNLTGNILSFFDLKDLKNPKR